MASEQSEQRERDPSETGDRLRRAFAWVIGPCLPPWIVFVVLAGSDQLPWRTAFAAAAAVFVLMALLVLTRLGDFDRLIRYTERLLTTPEAQPPALTNSVTAQRMLAAINALRKSWADRRDTAEQLARSRQDILDSLPEPLLLLDRRQRVIGSNLAARTLFEHDLIGRDLAGVIRDPKVLEAAGQAVGQNKRAAAQFSLPAPVERTFSALIVPVPVTATRDMPALILTLQELTERLKMDRMRADFVANASHELRTPLSSLLGFVETLRGAARDDPDARDRFLDIMLKQAERMTRLIDDLLSLSRIELREHTRPTEAVDIGVVVKSTAELLEGQARATKTEIKVEIPDGLPRVQGDAGELGQVIQNLTSNAIKYGGRHGPVEIGVAVSETRPPAMPGRGPCVRIAVRDRGEGIAKEHIPRLTERFYRVDNARSRELGGTGLGLAIVKHILNRHRGALVIDSAVGKGSTFAVYLPLAPGENKQAA
ncbi:MAG: two-component sensor histidine kinase [Rhodobacteraceae bacterium]|nr:two-component sensor histidine kinase [Paracoccaceae bacterium]